VLVPATMRLLGDANWWAPAPLRGFYRRYGLRESDEEVADRDPELTGSRAPINPRSSVRVAVAG
jgi:hypothetical protein